MACLEPVFVLGLVLPFRHRGLDRSGTGNWTKKAPNIGQAGQRILDEWRTENWTRDEYRRLDGFWLRGCLVVRSLGFGVSVLLSFGVVR